MDTKIFLDFEIAEGREKVMLSAPHPFIHIRNGEVRYAETNTDTLVKNLSTKLKVWGIYKTYASDNDANFDEESSYRKEAIKEIKANKINFLIDLHGMKSDRDIDICLGTNYLKNLNGDEELLNKIVNIFNKNGFKKVSIDDPFDAKYPYTVSSDVHHHCMIKTLQIEINGKYRLPDCEEFNLDSLEKSLTEIIDLVK